VNDTVHIIEMGARDGLQNEKTPVSPAERIAFIKRLLDAGLHTIEVGAFVSPRAIPQMVGSDEVLRGVNDLPGEFHVLVPNEKGYETADAARRAWRRYERGRHAAALNYGDCFSYALAVTRGEPLLFKGADFAMTDVNRAGEAPS
jgi:uncharacterized protein with PIN domain